MRLGLLACTRLNVLTYSICCFLARKLKIFPSLPPIPLHVTLFSLFMCFPTIKKASLSPTPHFTFVLDNPLNRIALRKSGSHHL